MRSSLPRTEASKTRSPIVTRTPPIKAGNLSRLDPLVITLQGFEDRADLGKDVKALVFGQQVDKGRQFTVGRFAGQRPE